MHNNENFWQPSASLKNLKLRAQILKSIRDFFAKRDVMEVETPLMCYTSVTDPFIESISVNFKHYSEEKFNTYYLQTSPEYAMKRLLAAGYGAIFQITKAFRQGEVGRLHNPEFTLLEWYRPHFNHHRLMDEMDDLLQQVLGTAKADRKSYADLFQEALQLNPHQATLNDLASCANKNKILLTDNISDKDTWLNLLMTHLIEPALGKEKPIFIYDFPESQAALARLRVGQPNLASRFEVYFKGVELANGFHELADANEQELRFKKNLLIRERLGLASLPIDDYLISALKQGLPDCSGVALGLDRLIMLATNSQHITEVISFDFARV